MPAGGKLLTPESSAPARPRLWRRAGFALLVAAVAVAGFWSGREIRRGGAEPAAAAASPPLPALAAGDALPDAVLIGTAGERTPTSDLLHGAGAALLFLEPGCPACGESVQVWQSWIEAGELAADRVIGISSSPPDALAEYRRSQGLTFPIYHDAGGALFREIGVTAVPLTVLVAAGGSVRRVGYEPARSLDVGEVAASIR